MARHLFFMNTKSTHEEDVMKRLMQKLEDVMVALTFAEAGEYEFALHVMGEDLGPPLALAPPEEVIPQTAAASQETADTSAGFRQT
jgi:hypothetical protein